MRLLTFLFGEQNRRDPRGERRRERRRRRLRRTPDWRLRGGLAFLGGGLLTLGGIVWLGQSGWIDRQAAHLEAAVLAATVEAGYGIDDVLVEGRTRTRRSAVLLALGVSRDAPLLGFDPHAARARLEALPWIARASVERRLPRLVYVRLVERQPLAVWQHENRLAVIDQDGAVIPTARPADFVHLPLLVGVDAPAHAGALLALLDREPDLRARVTAAVRVRERRWTVHLDDAVAVSLPAQDPEAAWANLARVEREQGLLARDVIAVDLRQPDRLIVRTAPGVELRRAGVGKDT